MGGIGLALRPAPHAWPPRMHGVSPPAHRRGRFSFLYISKEIGARLRAGGLPRRRHASGASPCRRLSPVRFRQASRGGDSLPKEERLPPGPPAFRAGNPPRRPSLVDSLCQRVSIISILKKLRCNRLFECSSISTASDPTHVCRTAPGLGLKTKKKRAADAALFFLNRYIWR